MVISFYRCPTTYQTFRSHPIPPSTRPTRIVATRRRVTLDTIVPMPPYEDYISTFIIFPLPRAHGRRRRRRQCCPCMSFIFLPEKGEMILSCFFFVVVFVQNLIGQFAVRIRLHILQIDRKVND